MLAPMKADWMPGSLRYWTLLLFSVFSFLFFSFWKDVLSSRTKSFCYSWTDSVKFSSVNKRLIKQIFYFYAAAVQPAVITANVGGSRARLNKINVSTNLSFRAQTILQLKWRTGSPFRSLMHVSLALVAWRFSKHISATFSAIKIPAIKQSRLNLLSIYKWADRL